jgi:hypothetical protein
LGDVSKKGADTLRFSIQLSDEPLIRFEASDACARTPARAGVVRAPFPLPPARTARDGGDRVHREARRRAGRPDRPRARRRETVDLLSPRGRARDPGPPLEARLRARATSEGAAWTDARHADARHADAMTEWCDSRVLL